LGQLPGRQRQLQQRRLERWRADRGHRHRRDQRDRRRRLDQADDHPGRERQDLERNQLRRRHEHRQRLELRRLQRLDVRPPGRPANPGTRASNGFKYDTIAPATVNDNDNAWHNAAYTVHLTATDATSGVANIKYEVDGALTPTTVSSTAASVTVNAPSDHSN